MNNKKGSAEIIALLIGIIIIVIIAVVSINYTYGNKQDLEITVKDKYIKRYDDSDTYMIVDTNGNAYKIKDMLFIGKFDSTDIYNKLEIGGTYKIKTTGYRNNFLSEYPNINEIEK